jgi:hypothetical protein
MFWPPYALQPRFGKTVGHSMSLTRATAQNNELQRVINTSCGDDSFFVKPFFQSLTFEKVIIFCNRAWGYLGGNLASALRRVFE